jgi:hypothetical protein
MCDWDARKATSGSVRSSSMLKRGGIVRLARGDCAMFVCWLRSLRRDFAARVCGESTRRGDVDDVPHA